jgi:hypothetical protein
MQDTRTPLGIDEADERRAFVAAASLISRLDECRLRLAEIRELYHPVAERREAAAIATVEGASSRPEAIARLMSDPEATMMERGSRTAADIARALAATRTWDSSGPSAAAISETFRISDASTARLIRPDMAWSLEEDCEFTAGELAKASETPEPWTAIEALRLIWTSGRFFGHSRRMALIAAPWLLSKGFGCSMPFIGLADHVRRSPEAYRRAEGDQEEWAILIARTVAAAASDQISRVGDLMALRRTFAALCPSERSSSSVGKAIDLLIESPVISAKAFAERLGLTPRGAKVVLDKLEEARIVEVEGGARNRVFVCRRAL